MSVIFKFYFLKYISLTFLIGCLLACQGSKKEKKTLSLFTLLDAKTTGVEFQNTLPETAYMNRFIYEYFYNGGGVAIGDINNDGLDDIYFTSNLKENKLYLNKGNLQFIDISNISKTKGKKGWATGVTMLDINNDGLLDIYVCKSGRFKDSSKRRNELFVNMGTRNNGIPIFKESAADFGLANESYSTQASFFDYDNDGDLDVFIANHNIEPPPKDIELVKKWRNTKHPHIGNKLLKNVNGKFEDATTSSGIHSHLMNYSLGVSISDLNNDGLLDVFVANDYSEPDYLYLNNGDGTFSERGKKSLGHMSNFSMGSDTGDINNDGLQDIITLDMVARDNYGIKTSMSGMNLKLFNQHVKAGLHYQYMYNSLQLNNGLWHNHIPMFSDIAQISGVSNTDWSWSPLFADFDNDGYSDLFVTNGIKRDFRNNDFNIFLKKEIDKVIKNKENPLKHYKTWTLVSPQRKKQNILFKNNGNLKFENFANLWGLNQYSFSNGCSYADLDNDGDLDLIVNNIDDFAFVYRNNSEKFENKNYLKVKIKGSSNNINGIGALVKITTNNGVQTKEQILSRGYQSSISPILHFGLLDINQISEIMIKWPDGKQQILKNVKANQLITLSHSNARNLDTRINKKNKLIKEVHNTFIKHVENEYNDYLKESLLPHKLSQEGPALAVGDVNNDGRDDMYIGGSKGNSAHLYIQKENGTFSEAFSRTWKIDKEYEDVDAVFFDADGDCDLDLYVVSGGNEKAENSSYYQDRIYENTGYGIFKKLKETLPKFLVSGAVVKPNDFDNDGDIDLFVGGRLRPQKYPLPPNSFLLENRSNKKSVRFVDVTKDKAPFLKELGMVTAAQWIDIDNDNTKDLIVVGEWMPIKIFKNNNGVLMNSNTELENQKGWWKSLAANDFDKDGDLDFLVGNVGLNYKYKASKKTPFNIYADDFDKNGSFDMLLGYYENDKLMPLRGRECTANQMPFIKEKFPNYDEFGKANLMQVLGEDKIKKSYHLEANNFASIYIENKGNFKFQVTQLPIQSQLSSVNTILLEDFNNDSFLDALLTGNMLQSEVETPRNDASYGCFLLNNGKGGFEALLPNKSNVFFVGEIKKSDKINNKHTNNMQLIFAKNNGLPILMTKNLHIHKNP